VEKEERRVVFGSIAGGGERETRGNFDKGEESKKGKEREIKHRAY